MVFEATLPMRHECSTKACRCCLKIIDTPTFYLNQNHLTMLYACRVAKNRWHVSMNSSVGTSSPSYRDTPPNVILSVSFCNDLAALIAPDKMSPEAGRDALRELSPLITGDSFPKRHVCREIDAKGTFPGSGCSSSASHSFVSPSIPTAAVGYLMMFRTQRIFRVGAAIKPRCSFHTAIPYIVYFLGKAGRL